MNVLYALSHLEDWVHFAKEMQNRLDWNPKYWICSELTEPLVSSTFPDCDTQSYLEIIKGESVVGKDLFSSAGVDKSTIEIYALEMDLSMKMMDRMDVGDGFSYNERKYFFLRLLNYSINVLHTYKPDFAVFTEIPHHAAQYVLYQVLKKNGVKTLMFKPNTTIGVRLLIYNDIYDDPIQTMTGFNFQDEVDAVGKTLIKDFVNAKRSDYAQAIPSTIKTLHKQSNQWQAVLATFKRLVSSFQFFSLFNRSKFASIRKVRNVPLEDSVLNKAQVYWYKWKGIKARKRLRKSYESLASEAIQLECKFVYIPLHYQPERTTSPDGGVFVEQILMIQLLRNVLPKDVLIYVKEHKTQYLPQKVGHLSRFYYQYKALAEMEGVELVSLGTDPFALLDKSWFVATVVGTTGLEAVARGKATVVFGGGCWFRSLEGVFFVENKDELKLAITKMTDGVQIAEDALELFMTDFYKKSFQGTILPVFRGSIEMEENVKLLANSVERYVRNVF